MWAWLIGPFIDAWLRAYPGRRAEARSFLSAFNDHLSDACIGTISEVFDASEPYAPRGCIAQAWSVAEVLRSFMNCSAWRRRIACQPVVRKPSPGIRRSAPSSDRDGVVFTCGLPRIVRSPLVIDGKADIPMTPHAGWLFHGDDAGRAPGERYWFRLAQGLRPDPVSRFQPDGPFGPSMVVDPQAFTWSVREWAGAQPRHRQVVYELHIGTFTTGGTWASARERLPHLASLGVTTLEVMPIAEFDGRFGWGYDGVFLFAPYHRYGTPDDVRGFVDAAHAAGLGVILDVVYNHLGPSGNVLPEFSRAYFADHDTEWGQGFNLDGDCSGPVRHFMRENVRHWLDEYRFDGLRFDATHAIVDRSPTHIVAELTAHGRAVGGASSNLSCRSRTNRRTRRSCASDDSRPGVDGLWNEDWHHSAFVALTGRREAYFTDYQGTAPEFASMARSEPALPGPVVFLAEAAAWHAMARKHPHAAFVCFLENHDQVANTGTGTPPASVRRSRQMARALDAAAARAGRSVAVSGPGRGGRAAVHVLRRSPAAAFRRRANRAARVSVAVPLAVVSRDARSSFPTPGDERSFDACRLDWRTTAAGTAKRGACTRI